MKVKKYIKLTSYKQHFIIRNRTDDLQKTYVTLPDDYEWVLENFGECKILAIDFFGRERNLSHHFHASNWIDGDCKYSSVIDDTVIIMLSVSGYKRPNKVNKND